MFKDTCVVVGVTGGIAAYKACDLVRLLAKDGMKVHVVMTAAAAEFVSPVTFRALSGNEVGVDIFGTSEPVGHVALARAAKAFVVAPCTANTMAKIAHGAADNLLTAMVLAAKVPVILAPAMNVAMWENPATRENAALLRRRGFLFVGPGAGEMACGEYGEGRLADVGTVADAVRMAVAAPKDLAGVRFVVTSGPTREPVDPVRFISNRSSGRMGSAVARALALRGAEVTFVHGPSEVPPPYGVNAVPVETAAQMRARTVEAWRKAHAAVLAAAVADFRPAIMQTRKMKKSAGVPDLKLVATPDILGEIGKAKGAKLLCGFAAETEDLVPNAVAKLKTKNLDLIVANDVSDRRGGFGSERNAAVILTRDGRSIEVPLCAKTDLAWTVADVIAGMLNARGRKKTL